jgi:hypothetical protein
VQVEKCAELSTKEEEEYIIYETYAQRNNSGAFSGF